MRQAPKSPRGLRCGWLCRGRVVLTALGPAAIGLAVLLCGAVDSSVLGTAIQCEAGALKWSPVNIPTTFPNLLCPAPGFCVGVKERQKSYEVIGDALMGRARMACGTRRTCR